MNPDIDKEHISSEEEIAINQRLFRRSFWDRIPMKRNNSHTNHIINPDFSWTNIATTPIEDAIPLPDQFEWTELDIDSRTDMQHLTAFLNAHFHSQTSDIQTRKMYTSEFLSWLLLSPTWDRFNFEVGDQIPGILAVQTTNTHKLVGVITFRPIVYKIDGQHIQSFYIDFVCVHSNPKIRGKHLGHVLIKECYRRLLRWNSTIGIGFHTDQLMPYNTITDSTSYLLFNIPMSQSETLIKPTKDLKLIRFATKDDIPVMLEIYNRYSSKYRMSQSLNRTEFEHYFLPNQSFVHTYVITNSLGEIKDFACLYAHYNSEGEHVAYLTYISFINEMLLGIFMQNLLYILQTNEFNQMIVNGIMGLDEHLLAMNFGFEVLESKNNLYLFNYNTPTVESDQCSINVIR